LLDLCYTDYMKLRLITPKDHQKLLVFWKDNYFVSKMDEFERFKLFLKKNPRLSFLIENDGEIIGTILGSFDGRRGYLQKIVIDKNFRGKGLGKKLVETVIKRLRILACTYITINVESDLVDFYKSCGFRQTEQIPMNMSLSDDKAFEKYKKKKAES